MRQKIYTILLLFIICNLSAIVLNFPNNDVTSILSQNDSNPLIERYEYNYDTKI